MAAGEVLIKDGYVVVNGVDCTGMRRAPEPGDPVTGEIGIYDTVYGTGVIVPIDEQNTFVESPHWRRKTWGDGLINTTFGKAALTLGISLDSKAGESNA